MTDLATTSTSGNTTVSAGLSFLNDIQSLLHGKGGVQKVAPALDALEQAASFFASLFPGIGAAVGIAEMGVNAIAGVAIGAVESEQKTAS